VLAAHPSIINFICNKPIADSQPRSPVIWQGIKPCCTYSLGVLNVVPENTGLTSLNAGLLTASTDLPTAKAMAIGSPMMGTAGDDVFDLSMGNNTIFAQDGNNVILTGAGKDFISAGLGNDIIEAGDGRNTIVAGDGVNLIAAGISDDLITSGAGGDFIDAGNGRNTVDAGNGKNRVLTGKGNDTIATGSGDDTVYSGAGNDFVNAGDGKNLISAGTGKDTVTLGNGSNRIILQGGSGSVTIRGFKAGTDQLRLGETLLGKTLSFITQGADTLVKVGNDLVATVEGVASGSQAWVDNGPLDRYTVTDLGSLSSNPNGNVNAASINDFGQIAGRYDTGAAFTNTNAMTGVVNSNNLVRSGFIWENGSQTALTSTGVKNGSSDFGAANGTEVTLLTPNVNTISNRGVVLGTADEVRQPNPKATDRALVWQKDGTAYKLIINDFGGIESYAFDTNNHNLIAGRNIVTGSDGTSTFDTPIYLENGIKTNLADLGGEGGTARGLNGKGQIVGYVDSDGALNGSEKNTAIVWQKDGNGVYQLDNLGTFGAEQATLRDINNAGAMIGATSNGSGATATSTPFIVRDAVFTALGSLGGKTGSVNGLNEFGQVVGISQTAAGVNHAYTWTEGVQADLNNLVTTPIKYNGAVVTLTSAVSVNNFGDIVAIGTYTYQENGVDKTGTRSYLLKAA
jgi:probable HAF family extracellular repeat protein